jgi:hypothetical protein
MPQWDFLNFFAEQAKRYPAFHLKMQAEVTSMGSPAPRRRCRPARRSPCGRLGA